MGSAAGPGAVLSKGLLVGVGTLSGIGDAVLGLPVLSQVEGSDLLCLLDLLLVGLDLALQLVDESLHSLVVLPVLVLLVAQLLDLALPLKPLSSILLTAELIGQPGGVNHGTLGLLLAEAGLGSHLVQVAGESGHLRLDLHLGSLDGLVLASLVAEGLVGVSKLLLNHTSGTVSLLQQSAGLLQSVLVGVALAVGNDESVVGLLLGQLLTLELGLSLPQTQLVGLDVPLGLSIGSVGVLQVALEVQDISLELLLHPESLSLALGFSLNSGLH